MTSRLSFALDAVFAVAAGLGYVAESSAGRASFFEEIQLARFISQNFASFSGVEGVIRLDYTFLGLDLTALPSDALKEFFTAGWPAIGLVLIPIISAALSFLQSKISQAELDATTRYELHTRLASMKRHDKVCHGDFTPGNIIITPEGKHFILDWSHATQGNGAADAARTYLTFCLRGQNELAEAYLKLFCEKTDTARQYVNAWMPIVAASQSVKGKPEEREFLLRWASVCDYQ